GPRVSRRVTTPTWLKTAGARRRAFARMAGHGARLPIRAGARLVLLPLGYTARRPVVEATWHLLDARAPKPTWRWLSPRLPRQRHLGRHPSGHPAALSVTWISARTVAAAIGIVKSTLPPTQQQECRHEEHHKEHYNAHDQADDYP